MDLRFSPARTCTDKIVNTQWIVRSMGVYLDGPAWMLEDNQFVIISSTMPYSVLSKRYIFLSYHSVRCAVAHDIMNYFV